MKIKREFFVEKERTVTLRFADLSGERFCPVCGAPSRFVTTDEAAIIGGTSSRQIFRLVENECLHSRETRLGLLQVCLQSLSNLKNLQFIEEQK